MNTRDTAYSCTVCGSIIAEADAFVRSVNLQSVAWCRPCWFAKNAHLPQQRTGADAMKEEPRRRRWPLRRRTSDKAPTA